jgi:hypothetical protein
MVPSRDSWNWIACFRTLEDASDATGKAVRHPHNSSCPGPELEQPKRPTPPPAPDRDGQGRVESLRHRHHHCEVRFVVPVAPRPHNSSCLGPELEQPKRPTPPATLDPSSSASQWGGQVGAAATAVAGHDRAVGYPPRLGSNNYLGQEWEPAMLPRPLLDWGLGVTIDHGHRH